MKQNKKIIYKGWMRYRYRYPSTCRYVPQRRTVVNSSQELLSITFEKQFWTKFNFIFITYNTYKTYGKKTYNIKQIRTNISIKNKAETIFFLRKNLFLEHIFLEFCDFNRFLCENPGKSIKLALNLWYLSNVIMR